MNKDYITEHKIIFGYSPITESKEDDYKNHLRDIYDAWAGSEYNSNSSEAFLRTQTLLKKYDVSLNRMIMDMKENVGLNDQEGFLWDISEYIYGIE